MADEIGRVREQWGGVIQTVIAACRGDSKAAALVPSFLDQMEQKPDWRALAGVLRRILAGEREPLPLLRGLDETDTLVAGDVLRGLGMDVPIVGEDKEEDEGQMMSLADFVQMVAQACRPDAPPGFVEQVRTVTRGMATQPDALPEVREFGQVLNAILAGQRDPDLASLPPQFAEAIRQLLAKIPH